MTAAITGELIEVNGCIRIRTNDEPMGYLVIWGPNYSFTTQNNVIEILNGTNQIVASVGQSIHMGGGGGANLPSNIEKTIFNLPSPSSCPGPFWVGADVVQEPAQEIKD
ncbi:MAG: hypothetical protein DHS20C20_06150 [Ardenticatenaceae bacterium]|nr:MAG: hypothetical protein DHS20C20_06150 [Ardenticatenaceae bacterium]